jgi:hypothetical protein
MLNIKPIYRIIKLDIERFQIITYHKSVIGLTNYEFVKSTVFKFNSLNQDGTSKDI